MELKSDIPVFQPNTFESKRKGWDKFMDRAKEIVTALAGFVGAEGLVRDMLKSDYKIDYDSIINTISAKITKLNNLASSDVNKIQNYIDQLTNMGFIFTGAALNKLQIMKTQAQSKLESAKNLANTISDRSEAARIYAESAKPLQYQGQQYAAEIEKADSELTAAQNYVEDLTKAYEKSKISI